MHASHFCASFFCEGWALGRPELPGKLIPVVAKVEALQRCEGGRRLGCALRESGGARGSTSEDGVWRQFENAATAVKEGA